MTTKGRPQDAKSGTVRSCSDKSGDDDYDIVCHANGATPVMQATLPDVPPDFLFNEIRDVSGFFAKNVQDIAWAVRYDPTTGRPMPSDMVKHDNHSVDMQGRVLAEPGFCYLRKHILLGRPTVVKTQITRVDDKANVKTLITCCDVSFLNATVTTTSVIERLLPSDAGTDPGLPPLIAAHKEKNMRASSSESSETTTNTIEGSTSSAIVGDEDGSGGGCRWTCSHALLPNDWKGRVLLWLKQKQIYQALYDRDRKEMGNLVRAARARCRDPCLATENNNLTKNEPTLGLCARPGLVSSKMTQKHD